jgi:hypothetical protein
MASRDGEDADVGNGEGDEPVDPALGGGNGGDGGGRAGAGGAGEGPRRLAGLVERVVRWLIGLLFGWIGAIVGGVVQEELDEVRGRYERGAREVEDTVDSAKRGVKRVSMLLVALLVFGIVTVLVWLAVGIGWLAINAPVPVDLFWFGAGAIAGYLLCLVTGMAFVRGS